MSSSTRFLIWCSPGSESPAVFAQRKKQGLNAVGRILMSYGRAAGEVYQEYGDRHEFQHQIPDLVQPRQ